MYWCGGQLYNLHGHEMDSEKVETTSELIHLRQGLGG